MPRRVLAQANRNNLGKSNPRVANVDLGVLVTDRQQVRQAMARPLRFFCLNEGLIRKEVYSRDIAKPFFSSLSSGLWQDRMGIFSVYLAV